MLFLEWDRRVLGLAHHLDLDPPGANIVEDQLVAGGTLGVDPSRNPNWHIGPLLTLAQILVFFQKLPEVIRDFELVRVGVWVVGLAEFVDPIAPNLEVLVRAEIGFIVLGQSLLLGHGGSGRGLLLFLSLFCAELLASLQFCLGDLFAGGLVQE